MTIRTISDLKTQTSLNNRPGKTDWFQTSLDLDDGKYASRKISFDNLSKDIVDNAHEDMLSTLNVPPGGIDLDSVQGRLELLESTGSVQQNRSGDVVYQFDASPKSAGRCNEDDDIPNREQTIDLIHENSTFITEGSYVDCAPKNAEGSTQYCEPPGMMTWHIDSGKRDSGEYVNEYGEAQTDGVECTKTGWLVVYGWLASNAEVAAQQAWVGLYGMVKTADATASAEWTLLQVQPWIIGQSAQVMQYVGFNVPVNVGLRLKIMTGFAVNGSNSGLHYGNSLMFSNKGNMPNTFVGYIVESN